MDGDDSAAFYDKVAVFSGFRSLMDPALYSALPDDWIIGTADIVDSTRAIAAQRYKAVNMAGASVIAAVTNALDGRDFPFVFGGDGASFAVAPGDLERAREAMAASAAWVSDELELTMRIALVPVAAVRPQGLDVRVARFAPSANVSYAMFSGGGLAWAEAAMKRGEFAVAPAPSGTAPDLTGLSCRFEEIPSAQGVILSVLIVPAPGADPAAFRSLIEEAVARTERSPDAGRPVPSHGPALRWPPAGFDLEARAARGGSLFKRRIAVLLYTLFIYVVMRLRITVGGFVPRTYIAEVVENSDFRKYDDGLRMILDCTPELADALEQLLAAAASAGVARYGLFRQEAAMMTCFTPSVMRSDHVHFIDGAGGGYASAAITLKAMQA
ncbi:DUF3095 domain-containing protein [Rhodopseudomonas palustris]|uniref:DUF3095 domain-containing protein n=1 Tax=Rhodopseudomonas palustris TaxID=1076 RepID=UPI002ACF052C|nr:DUF3095 domain-containing protein [Rhodopseudomonas palustris]WQG99867.1 DUF3095 domain-containing protein [Rhodopseudomonas palustris]